MKAISAALRRKARAKAAINQMKEINESNGYQ